MERQTAARIRPPCMHDHMIPANRVIQDFGSLTNDEVRTRMCLFSRSWTCVMSICGERMSVYREGMSRCGKGTFEWTKGMSLWGKETLECGKGMSLCPKTTSRCRNEIPFAAKEHHSVTNEMPEGDR